MTDSGFRIEGDPSLRITEEEIKAQREALARMRERLERDGKIRDLIPEEGETESRTAEADYRIRMKQSEDVRAGLDPRMHVPDDDELAEIRASDPDTAHLFDLGRVKPGTAEFHAAHTPPPEQVIEVIGAKGAEGLGVVKRYSVDGVTELGDLGSAG